MKCWLMGQRELFYYNYYDFGFPSQFNKRLSVKNICYWNDVIICYYPIPAPSSSTSFPLMDGNILKTSGCSCCVRCLALLSSIISSTLWAKECLFQNSIISSRVWADTAAATKKVLLVLTHFGVYYALTWKPEYIYSTVLWFNLKIFFKPLILWMHSSLKSSWGCIWFVINAIISQGSIFRDNSRRYSLIKVLLGWGTLV